MGDEKTNFFDSFPDMDLDGDRDFMDFMIFQKMMDDDARKKDDKDDRDKKDKKDD